MSLFDKRALIVHEIEKAQGVCGKLYFNIVVKEDTTQMQTYEELVGKLSVLQTELIQLDEVISKYL
jgi:hypothetical protein